MDRYVVPPLLNLKIYEDAHRENPNLSKFPYEQKMATIQQSLQECGMFEKSAEAIKRSLSLTPSLAARITALWPLSGPGTYDRPSKDDAYKDKRWADGMDRQRLNKAAMVAREIADAVTGTDVRADKGKGLSQIEMVKLRIKKKLAEHGPYIIYNGTDVENKTVADVITRHGIVIPAEKVFIIEDGIKKTVDQVKTFQLPPDLTVGSGDVIGAITHAPHMMRFLHMLNKYRTIPSEMQVLAIPLPSPLTGRQEYTEQEIRGLLYYRYLSGDATEEMYPHLLLPAP